MTLVLNNVKELLFRTNAGNLFQRNGAAKEKVLSPYLTDFDFGVSKKSLLALDLRLLLERVRSSLMYFGAVPCNAL